MKVRPISELDIPAADVEREIREIRAHAAQHCEERGERVSPELEAQLHEFLDRPSCYRCE